MPVSHEVVSFHVGQGAPIFFSDKKSDPRAGQARTAMKQPDKPEEKKELMKLKYSNTKYHYLRASAEKTGSFRSKDPHPLAQATNTGFYEFDFNPVGEAEVFPGYKVPVARLPIGEDGREFALIALDTIMGLEVDSEMRLTGRKAYYAYERRNGAFVDWMKVE